MSVSGRLRLRHHEGEKGTKGCRVSLCLENSDSDKSRNVVCFLDFFSLCDDPRHPIVSVSSSASASASTQCIGTA
jgi:hypothetical protein